MHALPLPKMLAQIILSFDISTHFGDCRKQRFLQCHLGTLLYFVPVAGCLPLVCNETAFASKLCTLLLKTPGISPRLLHLSLYRKFLVVTPHFCLLAGKWL